MGSVVDCARSRPLAGRRGLLAGLADEVFSSDFIVAPTSDDPLSRPALTMAAAIRERVADSRDRVFLQAFAKRFGCEVIDGCGASEVGVGFSRQPDDMPRSLGRADHVKILNGQVRSVHRPGSTLTAGC